MQSDNQRYDSYRLPVPKEYDSVFSHFYIAANNTADSITKTLLPSFQTIMVLSFGSSVLMSSEHQTSFAMDKCIVLGPIKSAFEYTLSPQAQIMVINFKDDAFYRFFGQAIISEFQPCDPDDITENNCFHNLWHQLNQLKDTWQRIDCLLSFCRPYLSPQNKTASLLANFKSDIQHPIKSIADETGQSERNIQLKQKKYFGYSAKELARYRRFMKTIELIQTLTLSDHMIDWFEVIDKCGYYDQSQLIHDFKYYINLSPKNYLKFQQDICQSAAD